MTERFVTRGFVGRRGGAAGAGASGDAASRTPPGQHLTTDFPVLSAGPTPRTPLDRWSFYSRHDHGDPPRDAHGQDVRALDPRLGRTPGGTARGPAPDR